MIRKILSAITAGAAAGYLLCRKYHFTPMVRICKGAFNEKYSSKDGNTPVVYEAIFLNKDDVTALFDKIGGKQVFKNIPKDYHVTTLYYPKDPVLHLYGTKVRIHVTGYTYERFLDENHRITGAEAVRAEFECDDPTLQEYIDKFHHPWHITGSYMTEPRYSGVLKIKHMKPVDFYLDGTFGAFGNGGYRCFDAESVAKAKLRIPQE
jgi:hypothetical protein